MTRNQIRENKLRRYRRIWGLFLQLSTREVARREGVSVTRIHRIVSMYARIYRSRLWRKSPDPIVGEGWLARYRYASAVDYRYGK